MNEDEAPRVRRVFEIFAETGSGIETVARLRAEGATSKAGRPLDKGDVYKLLNNRTYVGEAAHKGQVYPGEHQGIVQRDLWDRAHAVLQVSPRVRANQNRALTPALLKGLIFGVDGRALSPTHARKNGRLYRYYVAQRVLKGDAVGEDAFVSAYSHPVVEQLASQLSLMPAVRPAAAAEVSLALAPFAYPEVPAERTSTPPAPSPWGARPSVSVPTIDPAPTRAASAAGGGLAVTAFVWQLGALVCGVVAFGAVGAALHPVLGAIAGLFATGIAALAGGRRMRRANPTAGSAPVFIAALLFARLCALGGMGTLVGGAIAAAALVVSWNKAPVRVT